jgi:beta-glucanase (GH16 family)
MKFRIAKFTSLVMTTVAGVIVTMPTPILHAAPPGNSNDWTVVAGLTDEFDGLTLDGDKWHNHDPLWRGKTPVLFDPRCVTVSNGFARVAAWQKTDEPLPEGYTHRGGMLKAKTAIRYGYFEIRAKLADTTLNSCFWLYQNTPEEWTEIDVFEAPAGVAGSQRKFYTNVHLFHSPTYKGTPKDHITDSVLWEAPFDLAADYHTYGLEWNADVIRWYVDGKLIREKKNAHWHQPLHVCLGGIHN